MLLGVLTDAHLQTNVPGIYAAGDCAEASMVKISNKTIVSAIQPNAAEQARCAAINMVAYSRGEPAKPSKGVTQINVLDTLGLISCSFGNWQGVSGGEHVEISDIPNNRHLNLQFEDDVLVGCNAVGWTQHVGVLRSLVEDQIQSRFMERQTQSRPTLLVEAYLASAQGQAKWSGAGDEREAFENADKPNLCTSRSNFLPLSPGTCQPNRATPTSLSWT